MKQANRNYKPPDDALTLLNDLLFTNLTSKYGREGAGWGMPEALEAASDAGGFVSLRTGRHWVYRSFSPNAPRFRESKALFEVLESQSLAEIAGTQFNLLLPLPI